MNKVNVTLSRLIQVKNWPFVGRKTYGIFIFYGVIKYSKFSLGTDPIRAGDERIERSRNLDGNETIAPVDDIEISTLI